MHTIELDKESPNQSFFVKINGHTVFFRFATFRDCTFADIEFDEEQIIGGARVMPNTYILPKRYEEIIGGNFYVYSDDGSYPIYYNFDGVKNVLYFDGEIKEDEF